MSITWADLAKTGFYWIGTFECAEVSHRPYWSSERCPSNSLGRNVGRAIDLILSISSKWCLLRANKYCQFIIKQTSWKHAEYNKEMSNSQHDFSRINIVRPM